MKDTLWIEIFMGWEGIIIKMEIYMRDNLIKDWRGNGIFLNVNKDQQDGKCKFNARERHLFTTHVDRY